MKNLGIMGVLAVSLVVCASQQGSQAKPIEDKSLTCQQLKAAIQNAKAVKANADKQRGGNAGAGFVFGMLIPGAVGNQMFANQYVANEAFENAKVREEKLNTIYRQKNCKR